MAEEKVIAILRTRCGCLKEIVIPKSVFRHQFVHYGEDQIAFPDVCTFTCIGRLGKYAIFEENRQESNGQGTGINNSQS